MESFFKWMDKHGLLDYIVEASLKIAAVLGVILAVAWVLALAFVFLFIAFMVFAASGWWLLAFIPWLVLLIITIAAFCYVRDKL